MALSPIPVVVDTSGDVEDAPSGSVPIALYGAGGGGGGGIESVVAGEGISIDDEDPANPIISADAPDVDPVVQALIAAGFGSAGQLLATNSEGDGFEWVTPEE